MIILLLLVISINLCYSTTDLKSNGYLTYCPCMGRFGNQADHFLGVLAFSKRINRSLILPPWVEYRFGEVRSVQVPFDTYFNVDKLKKYHDVITMESFMKNLSHEVWPLSNRVSFCYTKRNGDLNNSCNAKSGNPFGPFWDTFNIDFVDSVFYGPLHYDAHNDIMMKKWIETYPANKWPVLAFTGAPASFPVQHENRKLHKYLQWNKDFLLRAKSFIKDNLFGGGFLGIHLRNGQDWIKACQHVNESPTLFASPQCVGYKNERGPLTMSMCLPQKSTITKQIKRAVKKINDVKYVFVASDSNYMINEISEAVKSLNIKVIKLVPPNPHLELAILGQANYFIGNCVSSFTAFVKRERDVRGLQSEFWSYPHKKKIKHEEL